VRSWQTGQPSALMATVYAIADRSDCRALINAWMR